MPFSLDADERPSAEALIKKSRFVARLRQAGTEDEAAEFIASTRAIERGAGHHCFAYIIGDDEESQIGRSSDDGEPGGTAGAPILTALKARDLVNVVAVVSRYFGGVKLGAGGLVRAYSGTVTSAIETATLRPRISWDAFRLAADHSEAGRLQAELRNRGFAVADVTYGERAVITVMCTDEARLRTAVNELTSGSGELTHVRRVWR
jgi:uncharacterized YigZ family protein